MSTAIVNSWDGMGEKLLALFLEKNQEKYFSIIEESLKIEIARCDRQIEYYQDLKGNLERRLEILNRKVYED